MVYRTVEATTRTKAAKGKDIERTWSRSHIRLAFRVHRGVRKWMIALRTYEEQDHAGLLAF